MRSRKFLLSKVSFSDILSVILAADIANGSPSGPGVVVMHNSRDPMASIPGWSSAEQTHDCLSWEFRMLRMLAPAELGQSVIKAGPHPPRADGEGDGAARDAPKAVTAPHPARPDGEGDGAARDAPKAVTDPIRLVRMVKEMERLREVRPHSRRISFTHATTGGAVFSRLPRSAIPSPSPTGRARRGRKKMCIITRSGGDRRSTELPMIQAFTGRSGIGPFFGVDGLPSGPDVLRKHGPIPLLLTDP